MSTTTEQRIADLLELAAAAGIALPLPVDVIARLEETGAVVDLVTGAVIVGGADRRYSLTPAGEALGVIIETGFLND